MDPMGYRSVVNHLRVLIALVIVILFGGIVVVITVRSDITSVSNTVLETTRAVNATNTTVRESHKLIAAFLEEAKEPLIRGAENSDAIKAYSAELTAAMRETLTKMEALEVRADRLERSVQTSQTQLERLLDAVNNPFRNVLDRFRHGGGERQ